MSAEISPVLLEKDAALARLGRCEARLKLRIGELLDLLFERGGHHELGFSSFEAYVVERCERSRSWGREARGFARRIRVGKLFGIRTAVRAGRLGWSMAELLARHATRMNEAELLEKAQRSTVRAMTAELTGKVPEASSAKDDDEPEVRATYWVNDSEMAMLSVSRVLVEYLNGARASDETLLTALFGEGETTLQSIAERQALASGGVDGDVEPLDLTKLEVLAGALREMDAEPNSDAFVVPPAPVESEQTTEEHEEPQPNTPLDLDREIVRCCRELARRTLEIGRLAGVVLASKLWRGLGYRSPAQYANERIGLSLSSLEHRLTLARRVADYPNLGAAIDHGTIGYEAALMIGRVIGRFASRALVDAWIERAQKRTVKHLREEVEAVVLTAELDRETTRFPPSEDDLEAVFKFQRKIQNGELIRSYVTAGARVPQMSVGLMTPSGKRRPVKLHISPDLYAHWRVIEAKFHKIVGDDASFIGFLCTSLWQTWLPYIEAWDDKWREVYRRDRHRCTSPVCERHDVTPHHLRFKSHGGSDAPGNMTSACVWCHLEGIHRGRLKTEGSASNLTWIIGRDPIMVVNGREKSARRV